MAVRRFLNGEVIPGVRVRVVRPDRHVREEIVLGFGLAVQHTVDDGHGLGAGDVAVGMEGAVGIAGDPAVVVGDADLVFGPVVRNVTELRSGLVAVVIKAGGDGGELSAGDGGVRAERAVGITRDDAHGAEGRDRGVVPGGSGHIGVAVGLGQVLVADVVGQQAEEDGRDLGAGDVVLRTDLAVAVTDDIGEVIRRVQTERVIVFDLHGGLGTGMMRTAIGVLVGKLNLRCILHRNQFTITFRTGYKITCAGNSTAIFFYHRQGKEICRIVVNDIIFPVVALVHFNAVHACGQGNFCKRELFRVTSIQSDRTFIFNQIIVQS